jgi:hypothetical protein
MAKAACENVVLTQLELMPSRMQNTIQIFFPLVNLIYQEYWQTILSLKGFGSGSFGKGCFAIATNCIYTSCPPLTQSMLLHAMKHQVARQQGLQNSNLFNRDIPSQLHQEHHEFFLKPLSKQHVASSRPRSNRCSQSKV